MTFTVRQLEIFVAAARDRGFGRTATRLEISQPAVSEHIRTLESRLGYALFQRRRGTTPLLTPAGNALLTHAQALLRESARIADAPVDSPRPATTTVRMGAGGYLLDTWIRPRLQRFCLEHSDIHLDFVTGVPSRRLPDLVQRGRVDLAVFSTPTPSALPPHRTEVLQQAPLSIVGSPAFGASLDVAAISKLPFVLPLESSPEGRRVLKMLRGVGIDPQRVIARTQYLDVVKKMVEAGKGIAVLFDECAVESLAAGRLVRIGPSLSSLTRVIVRGARARDTAVVAVEEFLRSILGAAS
jgi:DNA-binding transcriptional LysR family regulator